MGAIVKYGAYTPEAAEADEKSATRLGSFLKLGPGKHRLRFLPPPVGRKTPFKKVNQHFFDVSGEKVVFACPRFEAKKPCPGCQEVARLNATGNPDDREYAKDLRASERFFANVINRAEPEKGVQVYQVPWSVHQTLAALAKDPDAGGDFTNPESGNDIFITRAGTGKNDTKYTVFPVKNSTPLADTPELMQGLIDNQPDLDVLGALKSYDEIAAAIGGEGGDAASNAKSAGGSKGQVVQAQRKDKPRRTAQDDVDDAEVIEDDIPFDGK
jgi:hypothetical protein